jgi:prepilin-type N-terminal cleavage/methylation domain-containing protein/prepilin-type processing-associated H-X9-DG protein
MADYTMARRGCSVRRGVTMVELLVVIAIIALLITLLLPSITRVRQQANATLCQVNLRQIYDAAQAWKQRNDPQPINAYGWRTAFRPFLQNASPTGTEVNSQTNGVGSNQSTSTRVFLCPEDQTLSATDSAGVVYDSAAVGTANPNGGTTTTGSGTGSDTEYYTSGGYTYHGTVGFDGSLIPLDQTAMYVENTGFVAPLAAGPWAFQSWASATSYYLSFEDQGGQGGGDHSYQNLIVLVSSNGDGTVTVTLENTDNIYAYNNGQLTFPSYKNDVRNMETNIPLFYASYHRNDYAIPNAAMPGDYFVIRDSSTNPIPGNQGYSGGGTSGSSTSNGSLQISTITFGSAVRSSYGLNGGSDSYGCDHIDGMSDKVFAMDYLKTVADPTNDDWSQPTWLYDDGTVIFARHLGQANVVWGDGHVTMEPINSYTGTSTNHNIDPSVGNNILTYWYPSPGAPQ